MNEPLITTSCKNCIFAQFEEAPEACVQIGCELDRLDKFEERNEVKYEFDEKEKLDYAVIQRFCNTCRNHEWLKKNPGKDASILLDTSIDYGVVLVVDEFDELDIQYTLSSLNHQLYRPKCISITYKKDVIPHNRIASVRAVSEVPIKFTVVAYGDVVKTGIGICDNQFFIILKPGDFLPLDFSMVANEALNVKMEKFLIAKRGEYKLYSRLMHDLTKAGTTLQELEKQCSSMILEI